MTLKSPLYLQTSIFPSITWREDSKDDFFIYSLTPRGYLIFYKITQCFQTSSIRRSLISPFPGPGRGFSRKLGPEMKKVRRLIFHPDIFDRNLARLERLELPTRCLEGSCSVQTELQAHPRVYNQSGRPDLNRRPPAPKAGALARLRYSPRCFLISVD
jgi:hypothetical protein